MTERLTNMAQVELESGGVLAPAQHQQHLGTGGDAVGLPAAVGFDSDVARQAVAHQTDHGDVCEVALLRSGDEVASED